VGMVLPTRHIRIGATELFHIEKIIRYEAVFAICIDCTNTFIK